MLRVKTNIGPSQVHGTGLFAAEFIPKGTLVWELNPEFDRLISKNKLASLSSATRDSVDMYAYFSKKLNKYVHCLDNARFMNHSSSPNTKNKDVGDPDSGDIAARDIRIGEEITCDYSSFDG